MSKQDRQGSRTVTDLERKYKFGETFAKIMGIATDARDKAEEANKSIDGLDQEAIFNLLTNNGEAKGIYRDENGDVYVNASYILSGILKGIKIIGESGTIGGFTMSEKTISTTYRKDYSFTSADADAVGTIYMNWDSYSAAEQEAYLAKYDVNMNGRIDSGDAVAIAGMVAGTILSYLEGTITLDATNPAEILRIEVTGGYMEGYVTVLGMGRLFANNAEAKTMTAESYFCGNYAGYTGDVAVGDITLTIKGGIITAVS